MIFSNEAKLKIYNRTQGHCHLCGKSHAPIYNNYRTWHIEHSHPKALGGTNHLNNLFVACKGCNLNKGIKSTKSIRLQNGLARSPLSSKEEQKEIIQKFILGSGAGALIGRLIHGHWKYTLQYAFVGGAIGYLSVDRIKRIHKH